MPRRRKKVYWLEKVSSTFLQKNMIDLSEMGVVTDSKFVLEWIIKTVNGSAPVFVWGHSLGTG